MKRFILNTVSIWAFFAVLLVLIRILPVNSAPNRLAILHLNDCNAPRWIGITPGVTTLNEAKTRIVEVFQNKAHFNISGLNDEKLLDDLHLSFVGENNYQFDLTIDYSSKVPKVVNSIYFDLSGIPDEQKPQIGELITARREVGCVSFSNEYAMEFTYHGLGVSLPAQRSYSPLAPIMFIAIGNFEDYPCMVTWHGFTSFERYMPY